MTKNVDKQSGCGIAIAFWIIGAFVIFAGFGFVAMTDRPNEFMFLLFGLLGLASFITGIVFLVKGFRVKKKPTN